MWVADVEIPGIDAGQAGLELGATWDSGNDPASMDIEWDGPEGLFQPYPNVSWMMERD